MSIWTFKAFSGLAFVLALSSCVATDGEMATRAQPRSVTVTDANVVVAGPRGYCVDRRSLTRHNDGSFVLLASCESLARGRRVQNLPEPMLLTASVSGVPGAVGEEALLKRFFASDEGRAALSRDGQATTVEILDMFGRDDAFILHARDTSSGLSEGLRADYWRAFTVVNEHIVTASAMAFRDEPVSDEQTLDVLDRFLERIRVASQTRVQ